VKELKTKNRDAKKKLSNHKVRGVSPAGQNRVCGGKDLWKRYVLSRKWERELQMGRELVSWVCWSNNF